LRYYRLFNIASSGFIKCFNSVVSFGSASIGFSRRGIRTGNLTLFRNNRGFVITGVFVITGDLTLVRPAHDATSLRMWKTEHQGICTGNLITGDLTLARPAYHGNLFECGKLSVLSNTHLRDVVPRGWCLSELMCESRGAHKILQPHHTTEPPRISQEQFCFMYFRVVTNK